VRVVKRYYAVLASGAERPSTEPIRDNMVKLFGVVSAHEATLKVVEVREWGFVLRALMKDGGTTDRVALAVSFTRDGEGWLRPLHCSGTLKALRTRLKEAGLFSSRSG
jgi:RNase P/RNase MRP subunit POP5